VSARVDRERHEASIEARTEAAKERLRLAQHVLTCFVEGLGLKATAERVGVSTTRVWELRVWLGVQAGRPREPGTVNGRFKRRADIEEVRP